MSDFETIPASSLPVPPEEPKKEEEVKPVVEAVDWDMEPPAEEPKFAVEPEEKTVLSSGQPEAVEAFSAEPEVIAPPAGMPPAQEALKKGNKKTIIIVVIIAVLLLCLCCIAIIVVGALNYESISDLFSMFNTARAGLLAV